MYKILLIFFGKYVKINEIKLSFIECTKEKFYESKRNKYFEVYRWIG